MSETKNRNVFWPAVGTVGEAKKASKLGPSLSGGVEAVEKVGNDAIFKVQ